MDFQSKQMSEAIIIKNQRARELKISENTPRYPYFLVLKFQPDQTIFNLPFGIIFKTGKLIRPPCNIPQSAQNSGTMAFTIGFLA